MSRRRSVPRAALVFACLAAVLLAACSDDSSDGKKTTTTSTTTAAKVPSAPLTGLPDPTGVTETRAVLSIKVANNPEPVRPQSGLSSADVIYEEVVEGSITRFLAMYQSQGAEKVGPIRSVRFTDPLIVWPVGGVFAYSGGAAGPDAAINAAPVVAVNETKAGAGMFRTKDVRAPFNLWGNTDPLWALGGKPIPPPPLFSYRKDGAPVGGEDVTSVTIGFQAGGKPTWTWDAASGTFLRSYPGGPHTDRLNGQQLSAANVVIQFVNYQGGAGRENAEAQMLGTGPAWVLTGGKIVKGTWKRAAKEDVTTFLDADGKKIRLSPGKTWVELPEASYTVDVVSPPPPATSSTTKP